MRRRSAFAAWILILALLPLSACVHYPGDWDKAEDGPDPWQSSNRKVFEFNEGVDQYVLDPVATGWEFVTFQGLRNSVDKFFVNLAFPRRFLSNLGQAEFKAAGSELGRFLLNTTVGIAGFFDPATHFGMKLYDEDFGQMFGRWGMGTGPYWVLPLLGPSNPRDTFGLVFDLAFDIRTVAAAFPVATLAWTGVLQNVNRRALFDEDIDQARASALDFYAFMRDAYIQRREALVANEDVSESLYATSPADDALYEFEGDELDAEPEPQEAPPTPEPAPLEDATPEPTSADP